MKTRHFYLLIIFVFFFTNNSWALIQNELEKVSFSKNRESMQLYFSFTQRPRFSSNIDKRRLDIQFATTKLTPNFQQISPNKDIVKILSRNVKDDLIVSLFFRYQPQNFHIELSDQNTIVLNITPGNEYSNSYKNLEQHLKGISPVERDSIDFSNPYIKSPYAKNWLNFFKDFEPKIDIDIPVTFTTPPFPIISLLPPNMAKNNELLSKEMFLMANQGAWTRLANAIAQKLQQTKNFEQQKLLALVYGEVLARAGEFTPAYQQLYILNQRYGDEEIAVYAMYWLNLLRAMQEDPIFAGYEFDNLADMIPDSSPLAPYYLLSRIETALAAGDNKKLNTLLQQEDIAFPPEIENRIIIRQADYWQAIKEPIRAYAAYNLLADSTLIKTQPHSYNNFCATTYAQKKFRNAASCFQELLSLVTESADLGIISYKKEIAKLHFTSPEKLIGQFSLIESSYPGTTAQCLAEMKINDLTLLRNPEKADELTGTYQAIAERCPQRSIRETALFKEILLQKELGNESKVIQMTFGFLREFQSGDVRISAQALLIELIPGEIQRLVKRKEYIKALVLAKKSRNLFEKNWIDNKFLMDIATAYQQLGLFDEAQKLYLYLIEIMPKEKREKFYPAIIEAALNSGNHSLLDNYTSQYIYNYPDGKFYDDIKYIQLQSLIIQGKIAEAMELLPSPLPDETRFYRIKANIMFQLNDYNNCLQNLQNLKRKESLDPTEQFMMAESLFNTGSYEKSLTIYNNLGKNHQYHEQILYRQAQIARIKGDKQKAATLLKEIAENGKNTFWKNLAERELQYDKLKDVF